MKILVTGGLGSIGYVLVNFLKNHYDVYFCDLPHFNEKIISDVMFQVLIN